MSWRTTCLPERERERQEKRKLDNQRMQFSRPREWPGANYRSHGSIHGVRGWMDSGLTLKQNKPERVAKLQSSIPFLPLYLVRHEPAVSTLPDPIKMKPPAASSMDREIDRPGPGVERGLS